MVITLIEVDKTVIFVIVGFSFLTGYGFGYKSTDSLPNSQAYHPFSLQSPTQSFKERLLLYYSCHHPGKKPKDAVKELVYPISASPSASPAPGIQSVISEVTSTPVRFTFTLKV